ncbi:MAG: hypothetical protein KC613_07370 [Myxococcales bacterium]|nr:hypothetical protein [Myxococcales bacterium]MCB9522154.1 hypothetical protein [Myxococcales bacterium]
MSTRVRRLLLCLVAALWATPAHAVEVFVNGVKVTEALVDTTLDVTQVRFDAKGNVFIEAPGYKIEVAGGGGPAAPVGVGAPAVPTPPVGVPTPGAGAAMAPAEPAVTLPATWLVVNVPVRGHYKLHVTANGQPVADLAPDQPQYVADIASKLQAGANDVTVQFLPVPSAPATATPVEAVTVMVGQGEQGADGTLTISKLLGTVKHTTGRLSAEQHSIKFNVLP